MPWAEARSPIDRLVGTPRFELGTPCARKLNMRHGFGNAIRWETFLAADFGTLLMFRFLAKSFAAVIALVGAALTAPAMACVCANPDPSALEASASQFDLIFSGLIISTERSSEPMEAAPASPDALAVDQGYWIKSRVLVLRVWRGTPRMVTEVWTPVVTNCDSRPIPGLYFVALAKHEASRRVAEYSDCGRALRAVATDGPAAFAIRGIATIGAVLGLSFIAPVWLFKLVRRRRPSTGGD
jgi:hypothetical protein